MVEESNSCGNLNCLFDIWAWGAVEVDEDLDFCLVRRAGEGGLARGGHEGLMGSG